MEIAQIFIPIITAIIGYILGRFEFLYKEKRTQLKTQFLELYLPLQKFLIDVNPEEKTFSSLYSEIQADIVDMLIDKYEYAESDLKNLIVKFHSTFVKDPYNTDAVTTLDNEFFELIKCVKRDYNKLAKKLFYPTIKN